MHRAASIGPAATTITTEAKDSSTTPPPPPTRFSSSNHKTLLPRALAPAVFFPSPLPSSPNNGDQDSPLQWSGGMENCPPTPPERNLTPQDSGTFPQIPFRPPTKLPSQHECRGVLQVRLEGLQPLGPHRAVNHPVVAAQGHLEEGGGGGGIGGQGPLAAWWW